LNTFKSHDLSLSFYFSSTLFLLFSFSFPSLFLLFSLSFIRYELEAKDGVNNFYFNAKSDTDARLKLNENNLRETENELRIVRALHRARDKEWEEFQSERAERVRELRGREEAVREEVRTLSTLHRAMSEELAGCVKGESLALSLLKQRESIAEREKRDYEGEVRLLREELSEALKDLEREREKNKLYTDIARTHRNSTDRNSADKNSTDRNSIILNAYRQGDLSPAIPKFGELSATYPPKSENQNPSNDLNAKNMSLVERLSFIDPVESDPFPSHPTPNFTPEGTRNAVVSPLTRHTTFSPYVRSSSPHGED
jgi:hypothetical protein